MQFNDKTTFKFKRK